MGGDRVNENEHECYKDELIEALLDALNIERQRVERLLDYAMNSQKDV